MRDLVETIIGQVLTRKPAMKPLENIQANKTKTQSFYASHAHQPVEIKDLEMWDACCQFEAVFLQHMMQAMRKTVPESELMPRGYAMDMYNSMMDQAIAEQGSKQAPLGLAMNIYKQMQRDGLTHDIPNTTQAMQDIADTLKISMPEPGGPHG